MTTNKLWPVSALAFGALTTVIGGGFIGTYIMDAIVARAGDPDQSRLFWYLPILFMGIIGLGAGLCACVWGVIRLRKLDSEDSGTEKA